MFIAECQGQQKQAQWLVNVWPQAIPARQLGGCSHAGHIHQPGNIHVIHHHCFVSLSKIELEEKLEDVKLRVSQTLTVSHSLMPGRVDHADCRSL